MIIKIEICTDNAAFENEPSIETARILRKLADKLENFGVYRLKEDGDEIRLIDINGNMVGTCTATETGD